MSGFVCFRPNSRSSLAHPLTAHDTTKVLPSSSDPCKLCTHFPSPPKHLFISPSLHLTWLRIKMGLHQSYTVHCSYAVGKNIGGDVENRWSTLLKLRLFLEINTIILLSYSFAFQYFQKCSSHEHTDTLFSASLGEKKPKADPHTDFDLSFKTRFPLSA